MGVRVIVNEHAPQQKPNERGYAKEVKDVRPTTRYVLYDETTQKV